jgi:hypothetical protein
MNFDKCPSCDVKPTILKIATKGNGHLQFQHLPECQIGQAKRDNRCECAPTYRFYCSKCTAKFTLSSEVLYGGYSDGGGTASLDCPICWAIAEAKQ